MSSDFRVRCSAPKNSWAEYTPEHPKFKSRLCRHFLKGWCRLGTSCNFAHGWSEKKKFCNTAGKPENIFMETGSEPIIGTETDWNVLGNGN